MLVIPGGQITHRMVRDGDPIIEWVRAAHPHTAYTTSVCTGALLLGAAGLLDGLRATTHWAYYDGSAGYGARPTEDRVVDEGKILTAAGVSAGIDLALTLVRAWRAGDGSSHPAQDRVRPAAPVRRRCSVNGTGRDRRAGARHAGRHTGRCPEQE